MTKQGFETEERRAFELLSDAIHDLESYRGSRDRSALDAARTKIEGALEADPEYLRAIYYDAITDDLIGLPVDAPPKFERVLELSKGSPFEHEVRYNLGVAYYHRYSWSYLEKAIDEFTQVIEAPSGEVDDAIRLLARAIRAQANAMYMIPKTYDPSEAELEQIKMYRERNKDDLNLVFGQLESVLDPELSGELEWTAQNARGMALMYWSDYGFPNREKKKRKCLDKALESLEAAERQRSRDWANWCDLGSAHLRIAAATPPADQKKRESEFGKAIDHLEEVVEKLRPGYGFALYELGRLHRVKGDFDTAREYFDRALQVPPDERDVGDQRIDKEKERADTRDTSFP